MRQVNRANPALPVTAMKTYQILAPLATHFRHATCAEADCWAHLHGWTTTVDEQTDLGQRQAHYIRKLAGRRYREERQPSGLTSFTFEAGQRCFREHQVPVGRPEIFRVRGGDWRGNPLGEVYVHRNPADWVDDFANHQNRLADRLARG